MTIESFIKQEAIKLGGKVYIAPNISDKKMNGAIAGMAPNVDPDFVVAVVDTTVFGGAKEGCLFTGENIYIHGIARDKIDIQLSQIDHVDYNVTEKAKKNGKVEKVETLILNMKDNTTVDLSKDLNGINKDVLSEMLIRMVKMNSEGQEFVSTSQTSPLSMMDVEVKKNYVKLICNFAFSDDNNIDAKEYSEIVSLLVRIEMDSKNRVELRGYMINHENAISNNELLCNLRNKLKVEDYEMIKKSLIKDILYINRTKSKELNWRKNKFILELIDTLNISDEQVELINEAIINDEEILDQRKNDSEIVKSIKDIGSKATAVGVPLAAIYLSGSVLGVSAAGITSGLATLGMGGALGFSSMFTGIGVAVLIGVGTYNGLKKITGISDLENNKQRELMLQAIIRNSQKSLNYLIEDVNEITKKLMLEIEKGLETKIKIKELTTILGMLTNGAKVTADKVEHAEKERIIAHLPIKLDVMRLEELTNSPTKLKFREVVMSCYIEKTIENEDNTKEMVYKLSNELSIKDLNNLSSILDGLGYNKVTNASVASIKGVTKKFVSNIVR